MTTCQCSMYRCIDSQFVTILHDGLLTLGTLETLPVLSDVKIWHNLFVLLSSEKFIQDLDSGFGALDILFAGENISYDPCLHLL